MIHSVVVVDLHHAVREGGKATKEHEQGPKVRCWLPAGAGAETTGAAAGAARPGSSVAAGSAPVETWRVLVALVVSPVSGREREREGGYTSVLRIGAFTAAVFRRDRGVISTTVAGELKQGKHNERQGGGGECWQRAFSITFILVDWASRSTRLLPYIGDGTGRDGNGGQGQAAVGRVGLGEGLLNCSCVCTKGI